MRPTENQLIVELKCEKRKGKKCCIFLIVWLVEAEAVSIKICLLYLLGISGTDKAIMKTYSIPLTFFNHYLKKIECKQCCTLSKLAF